MTGPALYAAPVRVTLASPFIVQGLAARAYGVDARQMRDHRGRPIIPWSEIKGVLRHALEFLPDGLKPSPERVRGAFGVGDGDQHGAVGGAAGRRHRLIFSDLRLSGTRAETELTRVSIDDDTGAAKAGHLQVIELVLPIGEAGAFEGEVIFVAASPEEAERTVEWLDAALALVHAIGAFKTVGFGEVVRDPPHATSIGAPALRAGLSPRQAPTPTAFELAFRLDRPLVVDTDQISGNIFRGRSVIPGSVIKGALARKLEASGLDPVGDGPLSAMLSALTIGHAFPECDGVPIDATLPKSLVMCGCADHLFDVRDDAAWRRALEVDATALDAERTREDDARESIRTPLAFETDWKPDHGPSRTWSERETRTRVAIDAKTYAAARGQLFSHVGVPPVVGGREIVWRSRVASPPVETPEEREALELISGSLRDGVFGLGKSEAVMRDVTVEAAAARDPVPSGGRVTVMLRTPHLMLRCEDLASEATFHAAVRQFWSEGSGGALALAEDADGEPLMFATQSLIGGFPMVRGGLRGRSEAEEASVQSLVAMDAGSVFVLEAVQADRARVLLEDWRLRGLPDPKGANWRTCPYLRGNGYGAIEIDPATPSLPATKATEA